MSKNVGWQRTAASRCLVLRDRMKIVMGDSAEVFQRQARATPRLTQCLSPHAAVQWKHEPLETGANCEVSKNVTRGDSAALQ